jgi:hypothetical protein
LPTGVRHASTANTAVMVRLLLAALACPEATRGRYSQLPPTCYQNVI